MMGQSQSRATPYLHRHRPGIASILRRQDMWSKSQGRARGTSCGVWGGKNLVAGSFSSEKMISS